MEARLSQLRALLKENNVGAYIVYSEDPHQSEYTPDCDKRRSFISGFTGSAGVAVITESEAALWTDGRYYLQAEQQLSKDWKLMKAGLPETPSIAEWLTKVLPANSRVGVDPKMVSIGSARALEQSLKPKGHEVSWITTNLIDKIWSDKPAPPRKPVFVHPLKYSGRSHSDKLKSIREELNKENAAALVVSALDEVAWLLNLRGSDVDFNPGKEVEIKPYDAIFEDLKSLNQQKQKVWLDPIKCNYALYTAMDAENVLEKFSPITLAKSLKNETELEGLRQCHIRDAAALISYFAWLEERIEAGDDTLTECSVADKLEEFRRAQSDFVSLSFETISGSGPNGAIIHYKPEPETCAKVVKDQLYLCDSGGQYRDGTTDVTRTLHFGTPTEHQRQCYTRVLQGVIALDTAVWPHGTTGNALDILARMPLWKAGLDYRHGTGHGVGAFLNVHEGPQSVSFRESPYKTPLQPGMTITDEPGYYEDGNFGIRIENVAVVVKADTPFKFGDRDYYTLEAITLVPMQQKLIDVSLLTNAEINWIDAYHKKCLEKVGPLLSGKALEWLKRETQPLKRS